MNAKGRKRLSSALTEPNIAQSGSFGDVQDVLDRVRDIVPRKVIHTALICQEATLKIGGMH